MIRKHLKLTQGEEFFRWRGGDVSRLEGLSDGVFALSLTLIVVSLDVPESLEDMTTAFKQIPVFAISFLILLMCWFFHFQWHRRYGLEDFPTVLLNACFLFLILLYVYPLRFLFSLLLGVGPTTAQATDMALLMRIYSGGFAAIFLCLALMTWHAWRLRESLQLDEPERVITLGTLRSHLISVGFGATSATLAYVGDRVGSLGWLVPVSGLMYFGIGPVQGLHGWSVGRRVKRLAVEEGTA